MSGRPEPGDATAPARVLAWLEQLRAGIATRDEMFVWELLAYREARLAPRAVLEEALALVRAPAGSFRAPMALLRFAYVVRRLDEAGEPLPGFGIPASASLDAVSSPVDPEPDVAQLEIPWPRRGAAARSRAHDRRRPA